jgi:phospholipid transport system substrate-binding protein
MRASVMRIMVLAVWVTLALSAIAFADETTSAKELLKNKLDAVLVILQKKDIALETKKKEIIVIVAPVFDFSLMSKLTIGKKHWQGLPPEKRDRFTELFVDFLKKTYLDAIFLYTDEKVVYKESLHVKNKVHIPTELITKDTSYSMLYKFYKSKQGWKIYDIEIQGVSLIRTYRSQFDSVLRSGTIDDLILKLEKHEINKPKPLTDSKQST